VESEDVILSAPTNLQFNTNNNSDNNSSHSNNVADMEVEEDVVSQKENSKEVSNKEKQKAKGKAKTKTKAPEKKKTAAAPKVVAISFEKYKKIANALALHLREIEDETSDTGVRQGIASN